MYQIINKDNFDRDYVSEEVIVKGITSLGYAEVMTAALNEKFGGHASSNYFAVELDSYVPYVFEP